MAKLIVLFTSIYFNPCKFTERAIRHEVDGSLSWIINRDLMCSVFFPLSWIVMIPRFVFFMVVIFCRDILTTKQLLGKGMRNLRLMWRRSHVYEQFQLLYYGPVWFLVLESIRKFWPLITVLNKVSLQNQLQNLCATNSEESNEAFARVIRGWVL